MKREGAGGGGRGRQQFHVFEAQLRRFRNGSQFKINCTFEVTTFNKINRPKMLTLILKTNLNLKSIDVKKLHKQSIKIT